MSPSSTTSYKLLLQLLILVDEVDFEWVANEKDIIIIKTVLRKMLFYMKNKILLEEAKLLILYYI